jgi:hypothetical protein
MRVLRAIFNFFYEILLGCRHERLTRLFTIEQQTYKVCLECGKHIYYSAETMRPLTGRELRSFHAAQAGALRVLAGNGGAPLTGGKGSKAVA